jgi:nickel-dependent lactate racemase
VVASPGGHPKDINLIQAHKAMEHVQAAVADDGVLVLVAECRDGMGHERFLPWFEYRRDLGLFRERLQRRFEVYGQTAYALASKLERMCVILVSKLAAEQVETTGMVAADDLDLALRLARRRIGETHGWWVPHAGSVLLQVA